MTYILWCFRSFFFVVLVLRLPMDQSHPKVVELSGVFVKIWSWMKFFIMNYYFALNALQLIDL